LGNGVNEIVIGGHRDTVEVSPGAVDNTAGTSTVMEIARVYAAKCKDYINSKNYKLIFILFDGEEDGLLGSKYYVNTHSVSNTKYMLNFDCPAGYKYDVKICNWVTDTVLSNAVDQCCSSYNLPCEKTFSNFCGYDCSDYAPFEKKGVKHLFAVDLVQAGKCSEVSTGNKCAPDVYHTQNDNLNIIDKDKLVWAPKLGACVLRKLLP
jgi:Zn-dependent M28 family amino/carboxypeptidase